MKFLGLKLAGTSVGAGIAIGAGATLVGPKVMPHIGNALRTAAKSVIKGGLLAYQGGVAVYENGKRVAAETKEKVEDLAAEAKSEMEDGKKAGTAKKALPAPAGKKAKA